MRPPKAIGKHPPNRVGRDLDTQGRDGQQMISMGQVWDRTTAVIAGRLGILTTIALLLLVLPPVVQVVIDLLTGGQAGLKWVGGVVSIAVVVAATIATLAITAVATDPSVDRRAALIAGVARIGPMIGILVIVGIVALLAMLPGAALIAAAGYDMQRAALGLSQDNLNPGMFALSLGYFLLLGIAALWLGARLVPLMAVVVNERRGLGAIKRSFDLSKGSALKLIGVLILYSILFGVVMLASGAVVGLVVRLIVGADGVAAVSIAVALVSAVVTAAFSVVQAVFSGQFYLAARAVRDPA